jgi:hypothetical protein
MKNPLFYYKGGANVLSIQMSDRGSLTVYIPQFCTITSKDIFALMDTIVDDILKEAKDSGIESNVPFLFDARTKTIVNRESFIDFTPYYNIKTSLFIDGDDKKFTVLHTQDTSDYGAMQFLMLVVAKKDLIRPSNSTWTATGKKLLAFLSSNKYKRPISFQREQGCWDNIDMTIEKVEDTPLLDMYQLNMSRLEQLADDTISEVASEQGKFALTKVDNVDITLMDVLSVGLDRFFCGSYTGSIEVVIDTMADKYKSITIDTTASLCIVVLNKGADITDIQVKEDLQSDRIQVVSNLEEK